MMKISMKPKQSSKIILRNFKLGYRGNYFDNTSFYNVPIGKI